jgi:hypothetical protein
MMQWTPGRFMPASISTPKVKKVLEICKKNENHVYPESLAGIEEND